MEKAGEIAADIVSEFNGSVGNLDTVMLFIPGGRSIIPLFDNFNKVGNTSIPWSCIHFFWADERLVPWEHEMSNFRLAKEQFFDDLLKKEILTQKMIHPFITSGYRDEGALKLPAIYQMLLDRYECIYNEVKSKDNAGISTILVLGVGEDGHIASLFPGHPALEDEEQPFFIIEDSPKPPSLRMTIGPRVIIDVDLCLLLFFGEGKRKALDMFMDENIDCKRCPAKIALGAGKVIVITDIDR